MARLPIKNWQLAVCDIAFAFAIAQCEQTLRQYFILNRTLCSWKTKLIMLWPLQILDGDRHHIETTTEVPIPTDVTECLSINTSWIGNTGWTPGLHQVVRDIIFPKTLLSRHHQFHHSGKKAHLALKECLQYVFVITKHQNYTTNWSPRRVSHFGK